MISRKTLLRNVAGVFVSAKELNECAFKFFKLLVETHNLLDTWQYKTQTHLAKRGRTPQ